MKRAAYILNIIAGLLLLTGIVAPCQNPGLVTSSQVFPSGMIRERIFLFTDRTLYAVNENILFKADYSINKNFQNRPWSTVMYVELISQDGHSLVQRKFQLSETGTEGNILIPGNLPSGIYYLKAYTKWMRNFPSAGYEYKPVKIINPFTDKMESLNIPEDSVHSANLVSFSRDTSFNCSTDKKKYEKREKVTINVSMKKGVEFQMEASVSVCKTGTNNLPEGYSGSNVSITHTEGNFEYFPEPRGISISGKVINKNNKQEVTNALVHLSLLNRNSFYSGFISNSRGQFLFTFPFSEGTSDFYVEANKENLPLSLQIDDEFCNKPFSPGYIPFKLTDSEKEIAQETCINMQINKMNFQSFNSDAGIENRNDTVPFSFYGEPSRVIYTRKYIELTNIREFFFELVPEFLIEYQNEKPVLKLARITTLAAFPPLCLIDNVPVTDMEKFLNIPTEKIEKIEIIDKPYVSGNIEYNGIIQAFSKNRDMAGIDLSKNSMFFNYSLYSGTKPVYFPDYADKTYHARIPDRRNTLYWNPALQLKQSEEQNISFYTADITGEYEILIQGLSKNGDKIILGKTSFIVE